jgi:hypothetical protein
LSVFDGDHSVCCGVESLNHFLRLPFACRDSNFIPLRTHFQLQYRGMAPVLFQRRNRIPRGVSRTPGQPLTDWTIGS